MSFLKDNQLKLNPRKCQALEVFFKNGVPLHVDIMTGNEEVPYVNKAIFFRVGMNTDIICKLYAPRHKFDTYYLPSLQEILPFPFLHFALGQYRIAPSPSQNPLQQRWRPISPSPIKSTRRGMIFATAPSLSASGGEKSIKCLDVLLSFAWLEVIS